MTQRRLTNSRAGLSDAGPAGPSPVERLEGDPLSVGADAIVGLRPFGGAIPEVRLPVAGAGSAVDLGALGLATALAGRGRRLDAMLVLRQLIASAPSLVEPRVSLADLLLAGGETEEAAEALSGAIAVAADPVPLLVRRGALVAHLGRSREAEQDFRAAVKGNSSYWLAYRYLGISRLRAGAGPEAVTVLREAHTLAPQDPETVLYLGEALLSQGEFDEAHARLGQAVTMLPADPRGYTLLGRLFDRLGRKDEAIAMHRRATEASPE